MQIQFFVPHWGSEDISYTQFLHRASDDGYDGVEMILPNDAEDYREVQQGLADTGLSLIAHVGGPLAGENFEESIENYLSQVRYACQSGAKLANFQTGRDYYSIEQNEAFISGANSIGDEFGVKVLHETHRSKFSFAAHVTQQYLERNSDLRITADFSHWCCVAESLLEDQQDAVDLAISRADHIHARVGFAQGPQISTVTDQYFSSELNTHLAWWDAILDARKNAGAEITTITCEFGPLPYMPATANPVQPVADQWNTNLAMKEILSKRYRN